MKSIPPDELIHIIQHWINQDWPLTEEQAKQVCRNLGWIENEDGSFKTPYSFKVNRIFMAIDRGINRLSLFYFRVSDVLLEETRQKDVFMNDIFACYTSSFKEIWGKPKMKRTKDYQKASWSNVDKDCRIDLTKGKTSLSCYIYSPEYAEVERYLSERGL